MTSILGTDKIKGIVDINSLKLQIKKGSVYTITNDQLYSSDIQTAIKLGLIQIVKTEEQPSEPKSQDRVELRNVSSKPITIVIDDVSLEPTEVFKMNKKEFKSITLQPQQTLFVKEHQLKNSDLKNAISAGLLGVVTNKSSNINLKESNVSVACEIHPLNKPDLETNEELFTANVIDTDTPKPITSQDIPDDRKVKSVVWNPTKRPVIGKQMKSEPWEPKDNELSFVDKEEEQRKIDSHPTLKNKSPHTNDEITMVDQKPEEIKEL